MPGRGRVGRGRGGACGAGSVVLDEVVVRCGNGGV